MSTDFNIHINIQETTIQKVLERIKKNTSLYPGYKLNKQDVLELHSLFGALIFRTLELLDTSIIRYYTCDSRVPVIVVEGGEAIPYVFYADCNFCSCNAFKFKNLNLQYTCKHNLASRIAVALGKEIIIKIPLNFYKTLLKHIEKVACEN